jgi:hypothetical protein
MNRELSQRTVRKFRLRFAEFFVAGAINNKPHGPFFVGMLMNHDDGLTKVFVAL